MEIATFLLVIILIIIVLTHNSSLNHKIDRLGREISNLRNVVQKPDNAISKPIITPVSKMEDYTPTKNGGINLITEHEPMATIYEKPKVEVKPKADTLSKPIQPYIKPEATSQYKKVEKSKTVFDIEKFIGENLISKIGIIILVLGIGYFVKYAIDQNWINEYGRVAIGLLTGGGLVAIGYRMRKEYSTFSSLLTGGGFAVFYFTIAIAFHQYHLFSQASAFVILVIITIFSVILSLAYNKKELAIFSQLGGYAAPFMVSTGEGNYIVLFTYLLILNTGLIALAYYKRWLILNIIAYVFTVILFSSWLTNTFYFKANPPYIGALVFASIFYLVFFVVNILNNLKEKMPLRGIEIGMIISNNLFYFLAGLAILNNFHDGAYKGLFSLFAGIYNFIWVFTLYKNQQIDKNLLYLLIGLVMSYISLSIPIQLNGHSITLFWTAEFVILLWLSNVSGIKMLKIGHLIILILAIISLIMDWFTDYSNSINILPIILNRAFITGVVAIAGFLTVSLMLTKEKEENLIKYFIDVKDYLSILFILIIFTSYLVMYLELQYQMNVHFPSFAFRLSVYGVFNYMFLFALLAISVKNDSKQFLRPLFWISTIMLIVYIAIYQINVMQMREFYTLNISVTLANFNFHYVAYLFIVPTVIIIYNLKNKIVATNIFLSKLFNWFLTFFIIFVLSSELDNIVVLIAATTTESIYDLLRICHKVGYPILWGICAFILMIWGLKKKLKDHRIISLGIFTLIIIKLFLFDVWNMNEGGRIASFIFLGVILLIVSFLYQKLKKFILDEPENTK